MSGKLLELGHGTTVLIDGDTVTLVAGDKRSLVTVRAASTTSLPSVAPEPAKRPAFKKIKFAGAE